MMDPFRNYDAWLQTDPNMEDREIPLYRCCECGAFLKHEPTSSEPVPNIVTHEDYDGQKVTEDYSYTLLHRICTKCKADNTESYL